MPVQLAILGNPENRRVGLFCQAVEQLGGLAPKVLSYLELLEDPNRLQTLQADLLRIDSPGENEAVARRLIALGGGPNDAPLEFGQIAWLREYHHGFLHTLELVQGSGIPCLNSPASIATMFDKVACHQRFLQAGVARPAAELLPKSYPEFAPRLRQGQGRLFLKPPHGRAASGVCALRYRPGQVALTAPISIVDGKLFNTLQVRTYRQFQEVETILTSLLPQGLLAERWIPKLSLPQGVVDLRVLVIGGRARHRVVRQSVHPMTNLHLGNRRGDENELREHLGEERWNSALVLAEKAANCFPDCLSVGVDVLLDTQGRAYIGEVNAFGDLLPGLLHEGESAYQAIARAALQEGPCNPHRK